ncbi:DUF4440 domain-containing protein [Sphingomonas sabuli]|uniref:DUF4440 domain-containing protein n=1 Tax=Sphingomonas sabuli TaxID=2764186 RepID=A0A7G9L221_9SPHN|nr:DUF4440 domain-containing protein [Sphingomonas sabuli]QNM82670.1 DUF4440 domain-containing protein [Sphingomonas sabuli]
MADIHAIIETMEHRLMRAWLTGDTKTLKALTSRNFRMVVGSKPAVILDSKSWLAAAGVRFRCKSYRFGDIYARSVAGVAVFATQLDLEATLDREDWSGKMWVTDLWKKSRVRRRWHQVERILSLQDERSDVAAGVRSLQLWR